MTPLTNELYIELMPQLVEWGQQIADASNGEYACDKVMNAIGNGDCAVWLVTDDDGQYTGMCCAGLKQYVEGRVVVVWGVAGVSGGQWEKFAQHWDRVCAENDCVAWEAIGRRGFIKTLAPYGVKEKYVTMRRTINEE